MIELVLWFVGGTVVAGLIMIIAIGVFDHLMRYGED